MSSHHAHASSASDPRQPSTAKPYVPPTIAPQDLPIDYSGFIAIVFGITGVMLRVTIFTSLYESIPFLSKH
ncbi:hypothetical protein MRB53_008194 [Persea americana]|uniref:Uncharacterized protein n=1 Tax=Persea americana TaxID=3435 RepID=A0ACC2MM02_PERAE|nr:hypothetical protein MRB53_008194 [Persea americana]